jgi:glycolate oxidase FAD binding subunit
LEGDAGDLRRLATEHRLEEVPGPPNLPPHRSSVPPANLRDLTGTFVAEIGVGVVHRDEPAAGPPLSSAVADLHRALRARFDPTGRLNPGRDPLTR